MKNHTFFPTLVLLCLSVFRFPLPAEAVWLHLPFESSDRVVRDIAGRERGFHDASDIADQDDAGSIAPERYRVEGRYGQALRYFADDRSLTRVDLGARFEEPVTQMALSLEVRVDDAEKSRLACLVSNRADSDRFGFDLFIWGNELRFRFSDGERIEEVRTAVPGLRGGQWFTVEAAFDQGRAALWVNGRQRILREVEVMSIAPSRRGLFLGGYPLANDGRRKYAFDGWLDEFAIGTFRNPLARYLREVNADRSNLPPPPPLSVTQQPVDGNEGFFGGKRVFHSFHGHPLPMTFLFRAETERLTRGEPALVYYVPEEIELAVIHQGHHNVDGGPIETSVSEVELDGRRWRRHQTLGLDIANFDGGARTRPYAVLAFDADPSVQAAPLRHALFYDGEEHGITETELRFLPPPPPVPEGARGRHDVGAYGMMSMYAYPDETLWEPMAELLSRVGLTAKARFYGPQRGAFRVAFDRFLRERGFRLHEIGLWSGPNPHRMAVDPEGTAAAYRPRGRLSGLREGEGVMFDYEPWRIPYKTESFEEPVRRAFADRAGLETVPEVEELRGPLRRSWIDFWLEVGNNVYGAMGQAVRDFHPHPEGMRVSYTYFFPYDDEERLYARFWSIPKDPRAAERDDHVDVHLISMYHINYGELVQQIRLSREHLQRDIWGISLIARVNPEMSYATPANSLTPGQLEQKIVLCAAFGMERHFFYPGWGWLDGQHLLAIGRANRFIWEHEPFYFDGEEVETPLRVRPEDPGLAARDWTRFVHRNAAGGLQVTLFNFTGERRRFRIGDEDQAFTVELDGFGYASIPMEGVSAP